jgi:DnaJ-class molecular chaperone
MTCLRCGGQGIVGGYGWIREVCPICHGSGRVAETGYFCQACQRVTNGHCLQHSIVIYGVDVW